MLRDTLQSLAGCHPSPYEVIIVDGDESRSAENTVSGFADRFERVRYIASASGLTRQRNRGLETATGDVVVFFDDDVRIASDVFLVLDSAFEDDLVIGATGRVIEQQAKRIVGKHSAIRNWLPGGSQEGRFTRYGYPRRLVDVHIPRSVELMHGSFMSVRREIAADVGFDEHLPGYGLAEDEDFAYRLSRRGQIRYVPSAVIEHLKIGHGTRNARAFGRQLVVNRAYLLRKNFAPGVRARLQFALLVALFMVHRLVNREWRELFGLCEGSLVVILGRTPQPGARQGLDIILVSSHAAEGGSERYLEVLLENARPEWRTRAISLENGPLVHRLASANCTVDVFPTGNHLASVVLTGLRLGRRFRAERPSVVHANGVKAAAACAAASLVSSTPLVWVKHDFSWDGWMSRIIAYRCSRIVGVSAAVTETFTGRAREKVRIVHTGVDIRPASRIEARRALAALLGTDNDARFLGLIGRLHPVKGHTNLLDAFPAITAQSEAVQVVFVGGVDPNLPEYERELRDRAARLGVTARVHWLGHRDDAAFIMHGLDAGIIPTGEQRGRPGREGFPLVALEYLSAGVPVVAFDTGGVSEVMGSCGILIQQGDPAALADAVVALLNDGERWDRLASCGKARAKGEFGVARMRDELHAVYEEASQRA